MRDVVRQNRVMKICGLKAGAPEALTGTPSGRRSATTSSRKIKVKSRDGPVREKRQPPPGTPVAHLLVVRRSTRSTISSNRLSKSTGWKGILHFHGREPTGIAQCGPSSWEAGRRSAACSAKEIGAFTWGGVFSVILSCRRSMRWSVLSGETTERIGKLMEMDVLMSRVIAEPNKVDERHRLT